MRFLHALDSYPRLSLPLNYVGERVAWKLFVAFARNKNYSRNDEAGLNGPHYSSSTQLPASHRSGSGFDPCSDHVGFVTDKVPLGECFPLVVRFPLPSLIPPTISHSCIIRGWYKSPTVTAVQSGLGLTPPYELKRSWLNLYCFRLVFGRCVARISGRGNGYSERGFSQFSSATVRGFINYLKLGHCRLLPRPF